MIILRLIQKELSKAHIEQKGGIHSSWHKFNHLRKPEIQEETTNKHMSKYLKKLFNIRSNSIPVAISRNKQLIVPKSRILNG